MKHIVWPFLALAGWIVISAATVALLGIGWAPTHPPWRVLAAQLVLLLCAIVPGQVIVRTLRRVLAEWFDVERTETKKEVDRRPPPLVGVLENLLFPIAFLVLQSAGSAPIGAWISVKTLGNWSSWRTESDRHANDINRGRRLIYLFLVCNAWQVAWAAATAWAVRGVR